ncbi:SPFH domain-containing protein [bacterium]|nr:SPFH domain-containing protein [bacterium]
MALTDRLKYDAGGDAELVWKFPSEELRIGSQLVVNESQEAIFVKSGELLDVFGPGTHTLATGNLPFLNRLINFPFGRKTPFTAEVWFVNRTVKRDLPWGTSAPVQLMDLSLGFPVSVRAFGRWGFAVEDSKSLVTQITGSQAITNADKIESYFIGEIIQKVVQEISSRVATDAVSILQIAALTNELSDATRNSIQAEFAKFGLNVVNFNIQSINFPPEEMQRVQDVFAKTLEARELSKMDVGGAFQAIKSFEVMNEAAKNPSDGGMGAMLGAGLGLGAGLPIGKQIGEQVRTDSPSVDESADPENPKDKLRKLKELLDEELITRDEYDAKKAEIIRDI